MTHPLTRPSTIAPIDWDIAMHLLRKARLAPITPEQRAAAYVRWNELQARQYARDMGLSDEEVGIILKKERAA